MGPFKWQQNKSFDTIFIEILQISYYYSPLLTYKFPGISLISRNYLGSHEDFPTPESNPSILQ